MVANLERLERAAHKLGQIDDADPVDARIAHSIEDELFGGLLVHLIGPLRTRRLATLASRPGIPSLRLSGTLFPIPLRNRRLAGGIECTTGFGAVRRRGVSLRPIDGFDDSRINRSRPITGGIIDSVMRVTARRNGVLRRESLFDLDLILQDRLGLIRFAIEGLRPIASAAGLRAGPAGSGPAGSTWLVALLRFGCTILRFGGIVVSSVFGICGNRRPRSPIVASSIVGGSRGAFRQLHHHAIAILGDLNAGELAEQLRKLISAIAAHIEIGIALEKTAPNLSKARSLTVVLVIRNDIGHSTLDLLDARPAALPRIRSRLPPMAAPRRFAAFAHKQLKRGEDIARLAKRNGRLLLPPYR